MKKRFLIKLGVIINEENGKELRFELEAKNKTDALFQTFKQFDILDII